MKKRILFLLVAICMLLAACAPAAAPAAPAEPAATAEPTPEPAPALDKDLVILYTNDIHCGVDDAIGYAGLAAFKKQLENDNCYVALVDAGDAVQGAPIGTLSTGSYIIDIMNGLGYDVMTVGNHEFDYGMDRFFELREQADFPIVSANFTDLKTNEPVLDAYIIKEYNGVKVAFVGISTPKTVTSSTPAYFQDENGEFIYGFGQDADGSTLYSMVQKAVDDARAEGAQYVIAISHLGITADCAPWMSTDVIANTNGIDIVLDGHSHSVIDCERVRNNNGEWVFLSSTGTKLNAIGMALIQANGNISTGLVTGFEDKDAETDTFIKDIQAKFDETLKTVVAKTDVDLTITEPGTDVRIVRNAETNLGDLCADAYKAMSGADIAFVNGGGVRKSIAAGDITYEDILNVHPFGNSLCMVEATGQEILDALEMSVRVTPEESGGFLQVAGLSFAINTKTDSSVQLDDNGLFVSVDGDRRVENVMVGEEPIDPEKTYTVACHDYLLKNAGDGYTMFQDNTLLLDSIMLDNQVLINYITDTLGGVVGEEYAEPYGQGRIVAAD